MERESGRFEKLWSDRQKLFRQLVIAMVRTSRLPEADTRPPNKSRARRTDEHR
jgi:hypothetical protein